MKSLLCALLLAGFGTSAGYADTLSVVLDHANQSGPAGTTLSFFGTITNTSGSPINLNSDAVNIAGNVLSSDDAGFFAGPASLDASGPGATTGDLLLFTITIANPLGAAPQTYQLNYQVFSDDTSTAAGSEKFSVTTLGAISAVPEPASLGLVFTGLWAGAAGAVRRLRRA